MQRPFQPAAAVTGRGDDRNVLEPLFRPRRGRMKVRVAAEFQPAAVSKRNDDEVQQGRAARPDEVETVAVARPHDRICGKIRRAETLHYIVEPADEESAENRADGVDDSARRPELAVPRMRKQPHLHRHRARRRQRVHECVQQLRRQREPEENPPRQVDEEPDPVHHRSGDCENYAVGVGAQRMPAVDESRCEESRNHSGKHENSVVESDLPEIHFHFKQEEDLKAPRHARERENSRADDDRTVRGTTPGRRCADSPSGSPSSPVTHRAADIHPPSP